jgi:hypothetical protein
MNHQSSKLMLRTSTIIFVTTIMVEVPNILQFPHKDSNKAEPASLCCTNKFPFMEPSSKETDWNFGRTVQFGRAPDLDRLTDEPTREIFFGESEFFDV